MLVSEASTDWYSTTVAPSLPRQDQRRAIPIGANLAQGVALRTAMNELQSLTQQILPANVGLVFTGEAKELNSATSGVVRTFIFALLIVLLATMAWTLWATDFGVTL